MKTTLHCLHPKTIMTSDGRKIVVNCGECIVCRNSVRSSMLEKLSAEVRKHKFAYFGTLTYADRFLPRICIREAAYYNPDIQGSYDWRSPGYPYWPKFLESLNSPSVHYYRFEPFGVFDPSSISQCRDYSFQLSKEVFQPVFERMEPQITPYVPVLNYRDFQLFMKRLRKRIHSFCVTNKLSSKDEKVNYHVVGEYGPLHFRPHFHFLLFSDSDEVSANLIEFVSESWSLGFCNTSLAGPGSASYVASYLNCYSYLPRFYTDYCRFWRPFSRGSIGLGSPDQENLSEVELFDDERFDPVSVSDGSTYVQSGLPRSYFVRLYSRVSSLFGRGVDETYDLLCRISQVYRKFGFDGKKEVFTEFKTLKCACLNYVSEFALTKWIGRLRYVLLDADAYPADSLMSFLSDRNSECAEYVRFDLVVHRLYSLANNLRGFLRLFCVSLYDFVYFTFVKFSCLFFHVRKYVDRLAVGSLSGYYRNLVEIENECDSSGFSENEKLDALFSSVVLWYGAARDPRDVYVAEDGCRLFRYRRGSYAKRKISELLDFFRVHVKHKKLNDALLFNSKYLNQYGRFVFA
ncbi:replication initiator protein [Microvirus mar47]|uniref:Replication initiator protein n=1 Tax=Microvirus mar47 TaxID=2851182 RepID=A0A8F5MKR9_9VIRU|nr:replication initiator protein [Microvirus mar47]